MVRRPRSGQTKEHKLATASHTSGSQSHPADSKIALLRLRAPKTAAMTIDRPAEGGSLAAVMKMVAESIDLASLGVKVVTTRRTRAGGILLEVEGSDKAGTLERKIPEVVGEAARIRRPEPKTSVLLLNVPEWAGKEEIVGALASAGVTNLTADEVTIRRNPGGRCDLVASLSLPLYDAILLAELKHVSICWTRCRVKLLEKNQPTCFRCQGKSHLAAECKNEQRPRRCFRCNADDHLAKDCTNPRSPQHRDKSPQQQPCQGQQLLSQ